MVVLLAKIGDGLERELSCAAIKGAALIGTFLLLSRCDVLNFESHQNLQGVITKLQFPAWNGWNATLALEVHLYLILLLLGNLHDRSLGIIATHKLKEA